MEKMRALCVQAGEHREQARFQTACTDNVRQKVSALNRLETAVFISAEIWSLVLAARLATVLKHPRFRGFTLEVSTPTISSI